MNSNFIIRVWVNKNDPDCKLLTIQKYWNDLKSVTDLPVDIVAGIKSNGTREPNSTYHYSFRIAFYDSSLLAQSTKIDFFQGKIGPQQNGKDCAFSPIIHILNEDGDIFFTDSFFRKYGDAPRFCYIMDSGIWNYFARNGSDFWRNVKEIVSNWSRGYYDLFIAKEYADLNSRLARESSLYQAPGTSGGGATGHGADVSPFLFHSETRMRMFMEKEGDIKYLFDKYKWRFLLLDDKIDATKEDGILASTVSEKRITKRDILRERITSIFKDPDNPDSHVTCDTVIYQKCPFRESDASSQLKGCFSRLPDEQENQEKAEIAETDADILIVCVETNEDAIALLKLYEFDIILLDYLLGKKDPKAKTHDYGYELLTNLNKLSKNKGVDDKKNKVEILRDKGFKIGPQGKFFFMFISAFTTAVSERLTLEGLSRNEEIWEIGEGACPTNTPELFKYRLVHLMKRRLSQSGIEDMQDEKILDTIAEVYQSKEGEPADRIRSVREKAYEAYHKVLGLHYDYTLLRKYDRTTSRLVSHFLADKVHMGAMLEHLLQLIHLTAFGTVRQWPEIWEEFKYFTRTTNFTGENHERLLEISKDIEKYIICLKSE